MSVAAAERLADAVLYEGYVLYPYRASAAKNQVRWQVGRVAPRDHVEATGTDTWWMQTECLVDAGEQASLTVRVRALQIQARTVEVPVAGASGEWREVDSIAVDGRQILAWDEAVVREFNISSWPLDGSPHHEKHAWRLEGTEESELVADANGGVAARILRRRQPVEASVEIARETCGSLIRVRVRIENVTSCLDAGGHDAAARRSLAGTHTLLSVDGGAFISLLEPPPSAAAYAAACRNEQTWPVLVGTPPAREVMLSSPIILYDYPAIAPESPGDLCDATEIDEMLMLRVQTMTDQEKREARSTDARAAQIIDRADGASPALMGSLHGAVRHRADAVVDNWETFLNPPGEPAPEGATLTIGSRVLRNGSKVRLEPSRPADSMDIFLKGRTATVTAVYHTLENAPYVAVTLDDDPMGAAGSRYRRSLFFHPDEIVPIEPEGDPS